MSREIDQSAESRAALLDDAAMDALWQQFSDAPVDQGEGEMSFDDADAFTAEVLARWEPHQGVLAKVGSGGIAAAACAMAAGLALMIGLMPGLPHPLDSEPVEPVVQNSALGTLVEQAQHSYDQQAMLIGSVLTRTSEWVNGGGVVDWLVEPTAWSGAAGVSERHRSRIE